MQCVSLVALGSNLASTLEERADTLRKAVQALCEKGYLIRAISEFYRTPAFPEGAGPEFVNAAMAVEVTCAPEQFLADLHDVEAEMGRIREKRWGARTLDLDIVDFDARVAPDRPTFEHWRDLPLQEQMQQSPQRLILPHPRLQDRAFVLVPLRDVAPDWRHPVSKLNAAQMLALRPPEEIASVVPL